MKKISISSVIIWLGIIGFVWYHTHYIVLIIAAPLFAFMLISDVVLDAFEQNIKSLIIQRAIKICNNVTHTFFGFVVSMYMVFIGTSRYPLDLINLSVAFFITIYTCWMVFHTGKQMRKIVKDDRILHHAAKNLGNKEPMSKEMEDHARHL